MKRIIILLFTTVFILTACDNRVENNPSATQIEQITDQIAEQTTEQTFTKTELRVEGMTCKNCVNAVQREVSTLDGVIDVSVDLKAKKVTIEHNSNVAVDDIKERIMNAGYSPFE